MKKLILLLIVLLPILSHAQDIVFLKSGEQFNGKIISINENKVVVQNKENQIIFSSKDVATVRYGDNNNGLISSFHKTDSIVGRMIPSFTAINKFDHVVDFTIKANRIELALEILDLERLNSNVSYGLGVSLGKAMDPIGRNSGNINPQYFVADEKWDNTVAFSITPALRLNSHYLLGFMAIYFQVQTGPALFSDYYGFPVEQPDEVNRKLRFGWQFGPKVGLDLKFNNFHIQPLIGGNILRFNEINSNNKKVSVLTLRENFGLRVSFDYNRKSNKNIIKKWID
jgi:hypothetical protein